MTDAEFLALIAASPEDLGQLLVYADHLEERGDLDRARFVRTDHQVRTSAAPDFALAETLRKLGQRIEKTDGGDAWMEAIAHPKVRGTTWRGESSFNEIFTTRFLPTGWLNYTDKTEDEETSHQNGRWKQQGSLFLFDMNAGYAEYMGIHVAGRITGKAQNVANTKWTWWVEPLSATIEIPEDTDETVYSYTHTKLNKKPKKKTRKPKPAAKPAKKSKATAKAKPKKKKVSG